MNARVGIHETAGQRYLAALHARKADAIGGSRTSRSSSEAVPDGLVLIADAPGGPHAFQGEGTSSSRPQTLTSRALRKLRGKTRISVPSRPRIPVMEGANLTIALVGLIATVAGTYFGYVGVRGEIRRRRAAVSGPRPVIVPSRPDSYDVFVSYAEAEAGAAERLAGDLGRAGSSAFLVRWVEPGLIPLLESERALAETTLGVLLFGPGTMTDPRIMDEYAALLQRAYEGRFRFVPALTGNVELPTFAAIRQPVDLGAPGTARYDSEVASLLEIVSRQRRQAEA
ncbi:TIR domain-containing protein [Streptomyces triticiradicis]|uniref:TIR domain-containing protein n=1 Tax=Streptomyces triticiradicis TaxID=2651189 RepID=UPI00384C97B8